MLDADTLKKRLDYGRLYGDQFQSDPRFDSSRSTVLICCPFHEDNSPSFDLDLRSGLWLCRAPNCPTNTDSQTRQKRGGGDVFSFWMRRYGTDFPTAVQEVSQYATATVGAGQDSKQGLGQTPIPTLGQGQGQATGQTTGQATGQIPASGAFISETLVQECVARLWKDANRGVREALMTRRQWTEETLRRFEIGWDGDRFTIPIRRPSDNAVWNIRRYLPSGTAGDKFRSWIDPLSGKSYGEGRLWSLFDLSTLPSGIWVFLCEGETDFITAHQARLDATFGGAVLVTSTGGAGTWKSDWNPLFAGKHVALLYDVDDAGRHGAERIAQTLYPIAASVRDLVLPLSRSQFPKGDLSDWLNSLVVPSSPPQQLQTLLESLLPIAPPGAKALSWGVAHCPPEYRLSENGVERRIVRQAAGGFVEDWLPLSSQPLWLSGLATQVELGTQFLELSYRTERGDISEWFPAEKVKTRTGIQETASKGVAVHGENASKLTAYLDTYHQHNLSQLPFSWLTRRCGWHFIEGKRVFSLGPKVYGDSEFHETLRLCDSNGQEDVLALHGLSEHGGIEDWRDFWLPVLKEPLARLYAYAAFAAPMLRVVGMRSFVFYNYANTQGGKTACQRVGASLWGHPDFLMSSFNATEVFVEHRCHYFSDLPVFFDELQLRRDPHFLTTFVYLVAEEIGKGRGRREGGTRETLRWKTIAIANGEQPLISEDSLGGQENRVLEIYGAPISDIAVSALAHREPMAWGSPGRMLLRKFSEDSYRETLRQRFHRLRGRLEEPEFSSLAGGRRNAYAMLLCGGWEFYRLLLEDARLEEDLEEALIEEVRQIYQRSEPVMPFLVRSYQTLLDYISASSEQFEREDASATAFGNLGGGKRRRHLPKSPCLGVAPFVASNGDFQREIWLLVGGLRFAFQRFGMDYRRAVRDWENAGLLIGRKTEWVNGNGAMVLKVKLVPVESLMP